MVCLCFSDLSEIYRPLETKSDGASPGHLFKAYGERLWSKLVLPTIFSVFDHFLVKFIEILGVL